MSKKIKAKIELGMSSEYWQRITSIDKRVRKLVSEYGIKISSSLDTPSATVLALKNASSSALCIFKSKDRKVVNLMVFINHSEISSVELLNEALQIAKKKWPNTVISTSIHNDNKGIDVLRLTGWSEQKKQKGMSVYTKKFPG